MKTRIHTKNFILTTILLIGFFAGFYLHSQVFAEEKGNKQEIQAEGFFSRFYIGVKQGLEENVNSQTAKVLNFIDPQRNYDSDVIQSLITENKTSKISNYLSEASKDTESASHNSLLQEIALIKSEYQFEKKLWQKIHKILSKTLAREIVNGGNKFPCLEENLCFDYMDSLYKEDAILFGEKKDEDDNPTNCDHISSCRSTCDGSSLCREPCEQDDFHKCLQQKTNELMENQELMGEASQKNPYSLEGVVFKNYTMITEELVAESDSTDDAEGNSAKNQIKTKSVSHQAGSPPQDSSIYSQIRQALFTMNEISFRNVIQKKSEQMVGGINFSKDAYLKYAQNGPAITVYNVPIPSINTAKMIDNQKTEKNPIEIMKFNKFVFEKAAGLFLSSDQFLAS